MIASPEFVTQIQACLVLVSAQLCFSGWHILGSITFEEGTDPLLFCIYRVLLGTVLMHAYVRLCGFSTTIDPVDYQRFFVIGVSSFVSTIFTALALKYMSPSRFSIFQPSLPCLVAAITMSIGMEQINYIKILGVVFAAGGALVAELWKEGPDSEDEQNVSLGVACAVVQITTVAIVQVGAKPMLSKYPTAVVTTVYCTISAVLMLGLFLARIDTFAPGAFTFNGHIMPWIALGYATTAVTLYAFLALSWAGQHVSATVATAYFTFQPVGTCALSAVLLGAVVTLPEVAGGLLIVLGLALTTFAPDLVDASTGAVQGAIALKIEDTVSEAVHVVSVETDEEAEQDSHDRGHQQDVSMSKGLLQRARDSGFVAKAVELVRTTMRATTDSTGHTKVAAGVGVNYQPLSTVGDGKCDL